MTNRDIYTQQGILKFMNHFFISLVLFGIIHVEQHLPPIILNDLFLRGKKLSGSVGTVCVHL